MDYKYLDIAIEKENLILPNSDKIDPFLLKNKTVSNESTPHEQSYGAIIIKSIFHINKNNTNQEFIVF